MPTLYQFQKDTVDSLTGDKHICVSSTGSGKSAMMLTWAKRKIEETGLRRVLIVTTPSKRDSDDFSAEADMWCGDGWKESLSSFEVVSWHGLKKWVDANEKFLGCYVFLFDEVAKAKGYSSGMSKSFLKITRKTSSWTGYTATPGDKWIDFLPYFVATGKVKNKTMFMSEYANVQTFKGYPEIVSYRNKETLMRMWKTISYSTDTTEMMEQMPKQNSIMRTFKTPADYKRLMKTRKLPDGTFIDTTMGLMHVLRQSCFTKEKQTWVSDFLETLGTNAVFFCNYIEEEETLCEIAGKVLPRGAKVWRIDGKHHDIPTKDTIGRHDIVVAHYDSGGEALNLQFMNYWVAVSPNYSYSKTVQAIGRIKRIGQNKPMFFTFLKAKGTVEESVYKALSDKKDFAERTWCIENKLIEEK